MYQAAMHASVIDFPVQKKTGQSQDQRNYYLQETSSIWRLPFPCLQVSTHSGIV